MINQLELAIASQYVARRATLHSLNDPSNRSPQLMTQKLSFEFKRYKHLLGKYSDRSYLIHKSTATNQSLIFTSVCPQHRYIHILSTIFEKDNPCNKLMFGRKIDASKLVINKSPLNLKSHSNLPANDKK